MSDHTLIQTVQLPAGQQWAWYGEANIIGVSPDLGPAGRRAAIVAALSYCQHELADGEGGPHQRA